MGYEIAAPLFSTFLVHVRIALFNFLSSASYSSFSFSMFLFPTPQMTHLRQAFYSVIQDGQIPPNLWPRTSFRRHQPFRRV